MKVKNKKIKIFTSYYSKMSERMKGQNDIYIQVSNSVFCPKVAQSGKKVEQEIDLNFGQMLGALYVPLEDYYNSLSVEVIDDTLGKFIDYLEKVLKDHSEYEEANIFLLCHENLESKYKPSNEKVKNGLVKAGEWQMCHRRILADFIKDHFNIFIPEYDIKPENEAIVYRQYFK